MGNNNTDINSQNNQLIFLGGAEEIGANSLLIKINGYNIVVDCGLHPKKTSKETLFPRYDLLKKNDLENENNKGNSIYTNKVNSLFITHSHSDHLSGLPYFIKHFPTSQVYSTFETRDLSEIMLKDTAKQIFRDHLYKIDEEIINQYKEEILSNIWQLITPLKFNKKIILDGYKGIEAEFFWAGHLLGSASVLINYKTQNQQKNILVSGDINLNNQFMIKKAKLPNFRIDTLIIEATNCAPLSDESKDSDEEQTNLKNLDLDYNVKELNKYINQIANENGSILIPSFSLGKTQELLKLISNQKRKGSIPNLKIYLAGLSRKINKVYDRYCYQDYMLNSGFEVSDIEINHINYENLLQNDFFKEPSIVIASNGMLVKNTISYKLMLEWINKRNFGIAFIGYLDEESIGYKVANSKKDDFLELESKKYKVKCNIKKFRFTSHANMDSILEYISEIKPNNVFINHGSSEACSNLAINILDNKLANRVVIPELAKQYRF